MPSVRADRLTGEETRLLDLEQRRGLPLHAAWVLVFDGDAPTLAELTEHVRARLERVPRYRRRVVAVPLRGGRAVWADDPHLRVAYHVRVEALPRPADEAALARLASRVLTQRLDRDKPLWEVCLVEELRPDRFAVIVASHAALVDGERNGDIVGALLDDSAAVPLSPSASAWTPRPLPAGARLLADSARDPREAIETLRGALRRAREELERHDLDPLARIGAPPRSRLNGATGPRRRLTWLEVDLAPLRATKDRLGGTVNDLVLTAVAGALGRRLRDAGEATDGLVLRALIPVADARADRLLPAYAPLPVGIEDARRRHAEISRALDGLRASGRAAAADALSALEGFAPADMIGAAARLAARERAFNVAVINVPGPQQPRYLLGRELRAAYPAVPLAPRQALSIAVVSYAGRLCFGLVSDDDALPEPELLASVLRDALRELDR